MNIDSATPHAPGKGPERECLPAIFAEKSDQELRGLLMSLAVGCTAARNFPNCPIRPLQGLTHATLRNTVERFDRATCLDLLQEEADCRNLGHECARHQSGIRLPTA